MAFIHSHWKQRGDEAEAAAPGAQPEGISQGWEQEKRKRRMMLEGLHSTEKPGQPWSPNEGTDMTLLPRALQSHKGSLGIWPRIWRS